MKHEAIRFDRVTCNDQGIDILRHVNLRVYQGEIFGIIHINSLGQDRFIDLLQWNDPIHYGRIFIDGKIVNHYETSDGSINKYVSIIDKNCKLIEGFSAADNYKVFSKRASSYVIHEKDNNQEFNTYIKFFGLDIDGKTLVEDLTTYEKYVVEIAREVAVGTKIIILRDISNYIAQSDISAFHKMIKKLSRKGITIIYVGNHHEELFEICDRVTLWEDGTIIKVLRQRDFTDEMMLNYSFDFGLLAKNVEPNEQNNVLKMEHVTYDELKNFNIEINKGECVTILDKENIIFDSFVDIFHHKQSSYSGNIYIDQELLKKQYKEVYYLPAYPLSTVILDVLNLEDNLFLLLKRKYPKQWLNKNFRNQYERIYREMLGDINLNQYPKESNSSILYTLLYCGILLYKPKIVFISQPFASADMYLRHNIINLINMLKQEGIAVVILAVNISDSLYVSNKILNVYDGVITEKKNDI